MRLRAASLAALLTLTLSAAACSTQPSNQQLPTEQPAATQQSPATEQQQQASNPEQPSPAAENDNAENQRPASAPSDSAAAQAELSLAPQPYDHDFALSVARHLTEQIGPRTAGTDAELRAAQWLADSFRQLGYETEIIPFTSSVRLPWLIRFNAADADRPISALAAQGAPAHVASGPLVLLDAIGTPEEIATVDAQDAILVLNRGQLSFARKALNASAAGAIGLIIVNYDDAAVLPIVDQPVDIPVALIARSDRAALQRLAGRTASLGPYAGESADGRNQIESANVLARWPGGSCRIFVGAHYDSVPIAPGANDNASGTAAVLALARAYAGTRAAQSTCFAAFGAEELGILGSEALVRQIKQQGRLPDIAAMINLDAIAGGDRPIIIIGDDRLARSAEALAQQLQIDAQLGALGANIGSDHSRFQDEGIPILGFFLPNAAIHVPSDTYANLDSAIMSDVARLAHAALACIAADLQIPIQTPFPCESA